MGSPAPKRSPAIILRRRQNRKEPGGKACPAAGRLEGEEGLRQPEKLVQPQGRGGPRPGSGGRGPPGPGRGAPRTWARARPRPGGPGGGSSGAAGREDG